MKANYFKKLNSNVARAEIKSYYMKKYYNLFMNSYKWDGIDTQQKEFLMRQLWDVGTFATFKQEFTEGSTLHPKGLLVMTPYAVNGWNIYDYPVKVNLINTKGVKFIPTTALEVNKDVVLCWIQRSHKSIREMVEFKIDELVNIEMVIRANLKAHKIPFVFTIEPENEEKFRILFDKIMSDDDALFTSANDINNIKLLLSGTPYIIDKLYNYKKSIENELREFLGLDNLGVSEKKEHLITSEIEANDEVITESQNSFIDNLIEYCDRIMEVFGISVKVSLSNKRNEEADSDMEVGVEDEEVE